MSDNRVCGSCRYWNEYGEECRKSPPRVVVYQGDHDERPQPRTVFPDAIREGWCGQWAPAEVSE